MAGELVTKVVILQNGQMSLCLLALTLGTAYGNYHGCIELLFYTGSVQLGIYDDEKFDLKLLKFAFLRRDLIYS